MSATTTTTTPTTTNNNNNKQQQQQQQQEQEVQQVAEQLQTNGGHILPCAIVVPLHHDELLKLSRMYSTASNLEGALQSPCFPSTHHTVAANVEAE